jgi:hypothetical protein
MCQPCRRGRTSWRQHRTGLRPRPRTSPHPRTRWHLRSIRLCRTGRRRHDDISAAFVGRSRGIPGYDDISAAFVGRSRGIPGRDGISAAFVGRVDVFGLSYPAFVVGFVGVRLFVVDGQAAASESDPRASAVVAQPGFVDNGWVAALTANSDAPRQCRAPQASRDVKESRIQYFCGRDYHWCAIAVIADSQIKKHDHKHRDFQDS